MIKGKWYKFKKKWRNGGHTHSYKFLPDDEYEDWTTDEINEYECLPWAEGIDGGQCYGFEYGCEIITYPPITWLKNQIAFSKQRIRYINSDINFTNAMIDHIRKEKTKK